MDFQHEIDSFLKAIKQTSFPKLSKTKVVMEMIANAVAGLCAIVVYSILQKFFVVKSVKNLWGLAAKKNKTLISKDTFEWVSGILIFIIALFVFTYVESLIEKYLEERRKDSEE